jgi:hypothetical protein
MFFLVAGVNRPHPNRDSHMSRSISLRFPVIALDGALHFSCHFTRTALLSRYVFSAHTSHPR